MNDILYLLNITISGIKNIEKPITLDFYKKTVDATFNADNYRVKAIYGENGSGKSAIVTAVHIFKRLMLNRNYLSENKTQTFLEEIVNKKTKSFRFSFEYLYRNETVDLVCKYSIELSKGQTDQFEITHEVLRTRSGMYSNSKFRTQIECKDGQIVDTSIDAPFRDELVKASLNILQVKSIIGIALMNFLEKNQVQEDSVFESAIFSCMILTMNIKTYLETEDQHEYYLITKLIGEMRFSDLHTENWRSVLDPVSVNDSVIDNKNYKRYEALIGQLTVFLKLFKPNLVSIDINSKQIGDKLHCDLNLNYGEYIINREFESTGIKKLIRLFDCFQAASSGGIVFIDEMDSNLNDIYLCRLIEFFMYYGSGQLCFTTHNLDPMAVLSENKNSIDFLSSDNRIVSWKKRGNATPDNSFRNGMIEHLPFNIEASDFLGVLGE